MQVNCNEAVEMMLILMIFQIPFPAITISNATAMLPFFYRLMQTYMMFRANHLVPILERLGLYERSFDLSIRLL